MSGEILAIANDFQFCEAWRAICNEERAALPAAVRAACIERFRALTPYIDAGIERARHSARGLSAGDHVPLVEAVELIDGARVRPEAMIL